MKKYFSFFLTFSLLVAFGASMLSFAKPVEAATSDCKFGQAYDSNTGTPCSVIPPCLNGATINHLTGLSCAGGVATSTNAGLADFIVDSISTRSGDKNNVSTAILQALLDELGYLNSAPTGNFLSLTGKALIGFQKKSGITADRVPGKQTKTSLKAIFARNPALATKIATSVGGINGNRIVGSVKSSPSSPATTTSTTSTPTSCPAVENSAATVPFVATVTGRNTDSVKMFIWHSNNTVSATSMGVVGGEIPGRANAELKAGDKIVLVEKSSLPYSEVLGQFTFKKGSTEMTFHTNAGDWQAIKSTAVASSIEAVTADMVKNEITGANWTTLYEGRSNQNDPYIRGIAAGAKWISAFSNLAKPDSFKGFTIYVTKGVGAAALRNCALTTQRACPYPYDGVDLACTEPVNTITPTAENPNPQGLEPGRCGPSNFVGIEAICEGTYPNIKLTATLNFSPGRIKIVPDFGVNLALTGVPGVQMVPTENFGWHLPFVWTAPAGGTTIPLSDIESGVIYPLFLHNNSGFYRNGLFNHNSTVTPMFAIFQKKFKCVPETPPAEVTSASGSCTGTAYPKIGLKVEVTFSSPVTVTGTPQIEIKKVGTNGGARLDYLEGSTTNKLTFILAEPAEGAPNPNTFASLVGDKFAFVLPLTNASIKVTGGTKDATLTGEWNIPDATKACIKPANAPVLSTAVTCVGPQSQSWPDLELMAKVKVSQPVAVTGNPQMEIVPASAGEVGVPFDFVQVENGDTLVFKTPTPSSTVLNPYPYEAYVGNQTIRFKSLNGGTIKTTGPNPVDVDLTTGGPWSTLGSVDKCIHPEATKPISPSEGTCTGTSPGVTTSITVTFNRPVNVIGSPNIRIRSAANNGIIMSYIGGSGSNKLKFGYTPPVGTNPPPEAYTGDGTFEIILPGGAFIKNVATPTLPASDVDVAGKTWPIPDTILSCPGLANTAPAEVQTPSGSCSGTAHPNFQLVISVPFTKPVTVTGVAPKLRVVGDSMGPGGAILAYDPGTSSASTLVFKSVMPATYTYPQFLGEKFELVNGASIKTTGSNANANVAGGPWNIPDNVQSCINPNPSTPAPTVTSVSAVYNPSLESGESSTNNRADYFVTFSENMNVNDVPPSLKITGPNGEKVTAYYRSVSGKILKFHASYIPPASPTSGIQLSDFEGHGKIYPETYTLVRSALTYVKANLSIDAGYKFNNPDTPYNP